MALVESTAFVRLWRANKPSVCAALVVIVLLVCLSYLPAPEQLESAVDSPSLHVLVEKLGKSLWVALGLDFTFIAAYCGMTILAWSRLPDHVPPTWKYAGRAMIALVVAAAAVDVAEDLYLVFIRACGLCAALQPYARWLTILKLTAAVPILSSLIAMYLKTRLSESELSSARNGEEDGKPQPFEEVLWGELQEVEYRRGGSKFKKQASANRKAETMGLIGLGLSGGGIRSATFNLGILQGLAEENLIRTIDFLSTVSGGGYIGGWLCGLFRAAKEKNQGDVVSKVVKRQLSPTPLKHPAARSRRPIRFLRKYSNYLAPCPDLLGLDVWTIASIWIRNLFLNWLVLLPFLASVVSGPVVLGWLCLTRQCYLPQLLFPIGCAVGLLLVPILVLPSRLKKVASRHFAEEAVQHSSDPNWWSRLHEQAEDWASTNRRKRLLALVRRTDEATPWIVSVSCFLSFLILSVARLRLDDTGDLLRAFGAIYILLAGQLVGGGFLACRNWSHEDRVLTRVLTWVYVTLVPLVAAITVTGLFRAVTFVMNGWCDPDGPWRRLTLGPPMLTAVLCFGVTVQIGLMGKDYPDGAREWLARLGGRLMTMSAIWIVLFAISIYGPYWLALLIQNSEPIADSAIAGWIVTAVGGLLAGNSPKTSGTGLRGRSRTLEIVARVAPVLFIGGLLVFISVLLHRAADPVASSRDPVAATPAAGSVGEVLVHLRLESVGPVGVSVSPSGSTAGKSVPAVPNFLRRWAASNSHQYWSAVQPPSTLWPTMFAFGILLSLMLSRRIDVNEFSMHHFYKNRLVRCYLGASAPNRSPDPFTGFDPKDDMKLTDLRYKRGYRGPYPIINTAINVNRGSELATQERKAGSFFFAPLWCGFSPARSPQDSIAVHSTDLAPDGFFPTRRFGGIQGYSLGSALAISGAAANPNSGFHTSPATAFLLTFFNMRLGWWVGNPRIPKKAKRISPGLGIVYLLSELLGMASDRSLYLNLSDGGHFDNVGLYELVRRRCRLILISDAEQDADLNFASLASSIRKCRADFGVDITINVRPIREKDGFSSAHFVVGEILYPSATKGREQPTTGKLIYVKASLTGDEPEDIREFRSRFARFPHQSTSDQFFSESQFESYRHLGLHIARTALPELRKLASGQVPGRDPLDLLFPS